EELETAPQHHGSISVPFVILAALLMGAGLFLVAAWVLTFDWLFFLGVPIVAVGFLLVFHPLAGADR
ncbi:MAG: hypothetical protein L3J72_01225, partial [Thermoplasmata archaeon]|nr:hypothetical protein [Thermoplasmata archaeon]